MRGQRQKGKTQICTVWAATWWNSVRCVGRLHTVTVHSVWTQDTSDSCVRNLTVFSSRAPSASTRSLRTSSLNTNTGGTYITLQLHKHHLSLCPESVFLLFNGLREQRCRLHNPLSSILLFTTELHQVDFLHWLLKKKTKKTFSLGVPVFDAVCGL